MFKNFFWKSCHLWNNVEKYGRAKQGTNDNAIQCMCFVYWITKATHILWICSSYCFSTATMVTQMHLNVTLYIQCRFVKLWGDKELLPYGITTKQYNPMFRNFRGNWYVNFVSTMSPLICCIPFQPSVVYVWLLMQRFILFQCLTEKKYILTNDVRRVCYFIYYYWP